MKREKVCGIVRVLVVFPLMFVLFIVMWNAFCSYITLGMVAMTGSDLYAAPLHLLALAAVFYVLKPIYLWLYKLLARFIR